MIKCNNCGTTRRQHRLWWGFRLAEDADVVCCLIDYRSSSHNEYVGEGYSVRNQHCEHPWCDLYLGVNYPDRYCTEHR